MLEPTSSRTSYIYLHSAAELKYSFAWKEMLPGIRLLKFVQEISV